MNQGTFNRITDVLKDDNKIVIPDLQRDYCWGTVMAKDNKKSLTYNFTSELIKEAKNQLKYQEFSYGIIYTYEYPETFLYLCDGQQRLTTLYLIIGILSCYQDNEKLAHVLKLNNGQPRLKYEVRNTTDYFIKDLVNLTFNKQKIEDLEDVSKTSWYRDIYKDDPSVKNSVAALRDISSLINKDNFEQLTNFILDKIGFVYINLEAKEQDTKETYSYSKLVKNGEKIYKILDDFEDSLVKNEKQKSMFLLWLAKLEEAKQSYSKLREYGEKMYEIVNTCGDPMEVNEHQKSVLLSKIAKEKQKEWTVKWEIWQDFFWINRGNQNSADEGFNEFLCWIVKIEEAQDYSIDIVEEYFKAFFLLIKVQEKITNHRPFEVKNMKEEFIKNQKPDLMVLYPTLIYLKNSAAVKFEVNKYTINENLVNYDELFRYIRFFSNRSKNSEAFDTAIKLAKENGTNKDISNFIKLESEELKSILSKEEIEKLSIYLNCENDVERKEKENQIWLAEDHKYFNGKISPILRWLDNIYPNNQNKFVISEFEITYKLFLEIIEKNNIDKLRIALLSFSNSLSDFREGWSWGVERFYLGLENDFNFWRKWIASQEMEKIILLYSKKNTLDKIISDELNNEKDNYRETIILYLYQKASKFWQWNNNKRFFIYGKEIYFPNGTKVGENTDKRKIF